MVHWRGARALSAASLVVAALAGAREASAGASMLTRFDAAYSANKAWYEGQNNESGTLAWGEGYVLASLVEAYLATDDPRHLVELAHHADAALAQRDSVRGVADYRGKSLPCWRATKYSAKPYCWAVHTGMIATGLAELAALVKERPALATVPTLDGSTLGEKAVVYLKAAEDAAAVHADEWGPAGKDDGAYVFRPDMASFYGQAGEDVPLNMMNAMGLLHLALARVSASAAAHEDKARRLVHHFLLNKAILDGGYYWNYRGGAYVAPGEDISHGALSVRFVMRAVDQGIVVTKTSAGAFVRTFLDGIVRDTKTFADHVGGGPKENTYASQAPLWLATGDVSVHAVSRDAFASKPTTKNGSELYGMALLARHDIPLGSFAFYKVDWSDKGGFRTSTAANANLLVAPYDPTKPQLTRIVYRSSARTPVGQWDGAAYHTVTVLPPAASFTVAHLPFVPAHWFAYSQGKALYQLGAPPGFALEEPVAIEAPVITSTPPDVAAPGAKVAYAAAATGWDPKAWKLDGPGSVTPAGVVSFTAPASGQVTLELSVTNDVGTAVQAFTVKVAPEPSGGGGGGAGSTAAGGAGSGGEGLGRAGAGTGGGQPSSGAGGAGSSSTSAGGPAPSMSSAPVEEPSSCGVDARDGGSSRGAAALAIMTLAGLAARRRRS